jgi:hypothetical protein
MRPKEHSGCLSNNPDQARSHQEMSWEERRGLSLRDHVLTSLSWKGLERMVRLPSSMDFWNLAGICRPCSLS